MPRSHASTVIAADPDTVWAFLRDFNATPEYVEAIEASEIVDGKPADQVGCERVLSLAGGGVVRETLVALSDLDRTYTYHLTEGPFPFTRYYSTIRVTPLSSDGGSFAEWFAVYDCEAADEKANDDFLTGSLFTGGLAALRARFAGA